MTPGAPIHYLWTNQPGAFQEALRAVTVQWGQGTGGTTPEYLRSTPVDILVMQIFNSNGDSYVDRWNQPNLNTATITGMLGFARAAYQGNPNCQVYLYASHTMSVGATDNSMTDPIINYQALRDTLTRAFPSNKPAWVIPAPLAFNKMKADGYADLWSGDGHANDNGRFLLAMLFYSVIYRRDCSGASHSASAVSATLPSVSSSFATKAQAVAWDIAKTYALSGYDAPVTVRQGPALLPATTVGRQPAPGLLHICDPLGRTAGRMSGAGPAAGLRVIRDGAVTILEIR